ncbi:MAG: hypothetical protein F6K31_32040 [Symploca sp. SIO2G7]|nr:hypothetical protein [Symploca sp. SIO2G7]
MSSGNRLKPDCHPTNFGYTTTQTGLTIHAELDEGKYQIGQRISDSQLSQVNLQPADFHGEWNYEIIPNPCLTSVRVKLRGVKPSQTEEKASSAAHSN